MPVSLALRGSMSDLRTIRPRLRSVAPGNSRRAAQVLFQHGDRALNQISIATTAVGSLRLRIAGAARTPIRNEATRPKLANNARPIECKGQQQDRRQPDGFGPSLVHD